MPIFDFECRQCQKVEEHLVSSATTVICTDCSCSMDKLISYKVSFDLKGKGFHKPGFSGHK